MPHAEVVGPFPAGLDPLEYDQLRRKVLWKLPLGLYLVGTRSGTRRHLMTANLVTQVSTSPKLVAVALESDSLSLELVVEGRCFSISMLDRSDRRLVRSFVRRADHDEEHQRIGGLGYLDAPGTGAPIPEAAVAYLDCSLYEKVGLGSHVLVIGEVQSAGFPHGEERASEVLRVEDTRMNYGG